jgi:CRP/FNR family nitrogen fixation transcriptional regulator
MIAVAGSKSWQRYTIKPTRRREDDGGNLYLYCVFGSTMHGTVNAFGLTEGSSFWNDFRYRRGSEIFGEAEPADRLYQVKSGAVRTFKLLPDGRRQIGDFHLAGDIFGVESGDAYRFTAEAIVDTRVGIARRETVFCQFSKENTFPGGGVLKLVARNLEHAENHVLLLGRQNALEKIAFFLTEMDRRQRSPELLMLPMSRRDIADYLGLTHETVSRSLSLLRHEGILAFPGKSQRQIVLHNRPRLVQLAFSPDIGSQLS